jgi:hypothetical protein
MSPDSDTDDGTEVDADGDVDGDADGDTKTVNVDGLSFDAPASYRKIDGDDLTDGEGDNAALADLADRMGASTDQLTQMMRSVDLYLFSTDGADSGFVDNINVINQPGAVADDAEIKSSFDRIGATVQDIQHETTDAGEVAVLDYTLDVKNSTVQGRGMLVAVDGGVINITVSTTDVATSDDISDRIIDTLDTAD